MDKRRWQLTSGQALIWIFCLAVLAVGAKNFETGLTVDAPLYALIARNIVRTHDWFYLQGSTPGMIPFIEHPHLGLWTIAAVFKVLPIGDWSARIVGHVFYVAFLWMFFVYLRRKTTEATAMGAVLLLWLWFRFANFFSNVYLDPGTLFFGSAAVLCFDESFSRRARFVLGFVAGISLALCAMYKGLTVLGFLPAFPFLILWHRRLNARAVAGLVLGTAATFGLYYLGIRHSRVPDFLNLYFQRQWVSRFGHQWNWWGLVDWSFWRPLFQDTYWLPLLAPLAFVRADSRRAGWLPLLLVGFFVAMFAPAGRDGAHYRLMILPWLAWLIAAGTVGYREWNRRAVAHGTALFCLVAVLVLQYIPVRTHGYRPPGEVDAIERFQRDRGINQVVFDMAPAAFDFTYNDLYSWYLDLPIQDVAGTDAVPAARGQTAYLLFRSDAAREKAVAAAGWCLYDKFDRNSLWLSCGR